MAVTITQTQDGPSDVIYQYYFESDGVGGELNNFVLLDPAWLTTGQSAKPWLPPGPYSSGLFSIQQVIYNFDNFDVILGFGGAPPTYVLPLTPSTDSSFDFRPFGGMVDRAPISNTPTGQIVCKTSGFSSRNLFGFMILKVRKMRNYVG